MFFGAGVIASLFSASSESMLLNVQCSGIPAAVSLDQVVSDVIQDVQVVGDVQLTDDSIHSVTIECVGCDDLKYHQVLSWQGMVAFDVFQRTGILPTCNIHLRDDLPAARLGAPAPVADMPVELEVECKGLKESELSMKALAFSSGALKEAYNQVHLKTDGGDAMLSGLHFDHVERRKAAILGLESDEDMLTYNKNDPRAHPKNKGRFQTPKPSAYFYMGGWGCRLCPPDDDVMLGLGDSGVALTAWENAYAKALRDSPFPEFSGVQKCDINMHAAKKSATMLSDESVKVAQLASDAHLALLTSEVDGTEDIDGMPVEVAFDCKAVDEANLSLKALAYAGHALQEAYNQVHLKTDNGDAVLSGLHFDHVERRKGEALGVESTEDMLTYNKNDPRAHPKNKNRFKTPKPSAYFYMGGWGCRLCPPDDDVMLGLGDSGAALHAWENTFTAALQEGPFPEFKSANSCEITMKAAHGSASVAATA
ncbi:hypothetical protein FisN_36Hh049 [Fistulifera solaris]|uniref:Uncharacterized protein n=1 Tax=Fistulifera solaris TaxID=1519565 RepID=A0A1Z5KTB2_FISSO|nr:hypothetical protein FisN_36Hh049 [Fistulifera solaris]|eukprot:GAX29553.1 hypothetical protein FisN_36Hh049 [Fistulifera solaris]